MRTTYLLFILLLAVPIKGTCESNMPERLFITFRFVSGDDVFYVPWGGNDQSLERLFGIIDANRAAIASGDIPLYVDGYCSSGGDGAANFRMAVTRSNRVKSELITRKGLTEQNFITKNHTAAYTAPDGAVYRDAVVVTVNIPAPVVTGEPKPHPTVCPEPVPVTEPEPTPEVIAQPVPQPDIVSGQVRSWRRDPYVFAVRTNLLYDGFGLPTLGVEWRVNRHVGIKLDGSRSWWGAESGKVQKIWLVSPEVRLYLFDAKRFYVGASGNFGKYNVYKYPVGGLFSSDTGYQGKLWSAGATVGYQLPLCRSFSVDFNLGLGYTRSEYDSFTMDEGVRVYKDRSKTKNLFGPTQAGVSLLWTIGGIKH